MRGVDGLEPTGAKTQVCEFSGDGTVWLQARTPDDLLAHLPGLAGNVDHDAP